MKILTISFPLLIASSMLSYSISATSAPLILHQSPLFLNNAEKANVLVILDNSNSMDEDATGAAAGGTSANSKSEIARGAVKNLITNYTGKINMGLMAYQQAPMSLRNLHNAPYDASFDPSNYDPSYTGDRDSTTKRYRIPNTSNPGTYVYYNIGLPFYSNSNLASAYCYSTTADFDNGSEVYPGGPWDSYRCFRNKITTSDTIPTFGNTTSETTAGFTSFWFGSSFSPTDSDLAQNLLDFGTFLTWDWASLTWFANSSPGRGYLHTPIAELDASQATLLNTKLGTSQWVTNGPTDPALPLQNAGLTPLQGTLSTALDYFSGTALPADEGGPAPALPESCGKDFIALMTDGLPSTDASGNVTTDPALALADVAAAAGLLNTNGVETYAIGFALPFGTDPTALDSIAAAGGTNTSYLADDPVTLQATFDTIFSDILAKTGASSSAATNSTSLSNNSFVYQAKFNSGDWSGQLLATPISIAGVIGNTPSWDAATLLAAKDENSRVIITYGRDTNDGIPFQWSDINGLSDTTLKNILNTDPNSNSTDSLGSDRVDFIRGGNGGASSSLFRQDRLGKLGDIVHSSPNYVDKPSAGYGELRHPGYATFYNAYLNRRPMLYVGANDGMLHGFDAQTGEEILAYIPSKAALNINELTGLGYGTTSLAHRYFVDASPLIADVDVSGWKTILAGGLGAGGQGIYALDITNPSASSFTEARAQNIVLWEFTDEDDADLGYTFLDPVDNYSTNQSAQIVKMANNKWALILGNGYNNTEADGNASSTGHAYLYILFIEGGLDGTWTINSDYIKLDTGVGSTATPNGLATPTPYDTNLDGKVDIIYAGDLEGNLWKFDVSNSDPSQWGNKLASSKPLFTATDSSSTPQPITSAPIVTKFPGDGYMVGFGTGKYIELSDVGTTGTQSFYGLRDQNTHISSRSLLAEQTILATTTLSGNPVRVTSKNSVDYLTQKGWYVDLPESGERADLNPVLLDGRFLFVTRTPSNAVCVAGGTSWLMQLNYLTGGRINQSPFDTNNDGVINEDDYATVIVDGVEITVPVSGMGSNDSMFSRPSIIRDANNSAIEHALTQNTDGDSQVFRLSVEERYSGRIYWKEVR